MINFENYTYEEILAHIIDNIHTADPTIDTREGSPLWYAIAPVALELAIAYSNAEAVVGEGFVGTASRAGMYSAFNDIGVSTEQFEPTRSVFSAYFNIEVNLGSRWYAGGYNFTVTEADGEITIGATTYKKYLLTCETVGSATISVTGTLRPIDDFGDGDLTTAKLLECVVKGGDEVPDEEVRAAYFDYVRNKGEGGNVQQYKQWVAEIEGVGASVVTPCWNGANTVKVAILGEDKKPPTGTTLRDKVQEILDPGSSGLGNGKAPIGAKVTVVSGAAVGIDIKASIVLTETGADISEITERLSAYFADIAYRQFEVNYFGVASVILACSCVSTMNNLQIKKSTSSAWGTSNITLGEYECPVLNNFTNG